MSILDMNFDEIPDRFDLTDGTYRFLVKKVAVKEIEKQGGEKDEIVTITVEALQVIDAEDVGPLELAKPVYMEFWASSAPETNPARSYKQFIQGVLGVAVSNIRTAFDNTPGHEFIGTVKTFMKGKEKDRPTPVIVKVTAA